MSIFSVRLEELREFLGIKGKVFAEQMGIPYRSYMNYKGGRTPPADLLSRVVEVFSVNPAWLISGEGMMFADADATGEPIDHGQEISEERTAEEDSDLALSADTQSPNQAFSFGQAAEGESPQEFQMRLLRHLMDLHEENRALRDKVQELEVQVTIERSNVRRLRRDFR